MNGVPNTETYGATPARRPLMLGMGWFPNQEGGLNRYFRDLQIAFQQGGVFAQALSLGPPSDSAPGVHFAGRRGDSLPRRLYSYFRAADSFAEQTSLVDSHFALYSALPILVGRLRNKPLVVHFQGPWAYESSNSGNGWIRTTAKHLLERAVYRRARAVVVLSQDFKRVLIDKYDVSPWLIHVVPPAVDHEWFSPGKPEESRRILDLPKNAWIAVSVRRLVPRMGLETLLDAWKRLLQETNRDNVLLVVVGDGPESQALRAQASRLGIGGRVRFVGRVNDNELVHYYRSADVSVVPSKALEGFGLVVLESLASGTPVIASDAGGLPEALGPFDRGLIVPANDAKALSSRLLSAQNARHPLPDRLACRRYAETFSWPSVVGKTVEIYRHAQVGARSRKPRVVYLDHCARPSGGELALLRLLPALREVDSHVILGDNGPIVPRLHEAGISVEVLLLNDRARELRRDRIRPSSIPPTVALSTIAYVLRLARRLRRLRPDLVHTNSLKAAVYGGLAAKLVGLPVVWHVRDRISEDYLPDPAARMMRWLAPRLTVGIIANSQATLSTLNLPVVSGAVIPSPVVFDPVREELSNDRSNPRRNGNFTVGMLGRIAPWKGQHVFVDAFARAFPQGSERAVIVGAPLFGEHDYAEQLRAQAARLGLDGRLEFPGFREDITRELARWNVLVHASVIAEPFGQVVVEGMAAGIPVVAAAAGGPSEVITDGKNGLLYPPGDAAALAAILRRLADDSSLRRRLGRAARRRAEDFKPAVVAEQVMDVYRLVLRKSPMANQLDIFQKERVLP